MLVPGLAPPSDVCNPLGSGARETGIHEVTGSIPVSSTKSGNSLELEDAPGVQRQRAEGWEGSRPETEANIQ